MFPTCILLIEMTVSVGFIEETSLENTLLQTRYNTFALHKDTSLAAPAQVPRRQ